MPRRPAGTPTTTGPGDAEKSTRVAAITVREIARFYLPLVLTSQMMTLSGPIINMGIGRSSDPTLNFAGYWIGFAILLFLQSPCMVVQQVVAALVNGYQSIRMLAMSTLALGLLASSSILAVALTPLGGGLLDSLIPTTPRVAELVRSVLLIFSPIPILITIRGIANGIALKEKRTVLIARATFIRLIVLSSIVAWMVLIGTGSGAKAGAAAVVAGIFFETVAVALAVAPTVRRQRREGAHDGPRLDGRLIYRVAAPLIISAFVWTVARPLINAILGTLPDPETAQAGFGVIIPLVLVTCSPLWALQNVSLVLPETRADLNAIIRFAAITALGFSAAILLLAASPLRGLVLREVFQLTPALERLVAPAMLLAAAEPLFLAARSLSQGLLMKAKRTEAFLVFSPIKILLIGGVGYAVARLDPAVNGALLGTALFIGGDLFDGLAYGLRVRGMVRRGIVCKG